MKKQRIIPAPVISTAFVTEDIHKIREWNYERRKGMTAQEICDDTHKGAEMFSKLLCMPIKTDVLAEVNRRLQSTG